MLELEIFDALQSLAPMPKHRPPKYIGKFPMRVRDRFRKQPAYTIMIVPVYVDARHISRSKYTPHIGKKRGGN